MLRRVQQQAAAAGLVRSREATPAPGGGGGDEAGGGGGGGAAAAAPAVVGPTGRLPAALLMRKHKLHLEVRNGKERGRETQGNSRLSQSEARARKGWCASIRCTSS